MASRTSGSGSTIEEIAAIDELITDLEKRFRRLNGAAKREVSGAKGDVREFVSDALANITNRARGRANTITDIVADEAARFGGTAFKRAVREVEQNPVAMLAVAAGIGFLFGVARR